MNTRPSFRRSPIPEQEPAAISSPAEFAASAGAPEGRGFADPRILFSFILVTLIWGSTWIVIKDQLGIVPPTWSVTYRYVIACAAMFVIARFSGGSLGIGRNGHLLAALIGFPQFFLNFNFVYAAEHYITSGLAAVVFALLLVPNSALAWIFFKHRVTAAFGIGSGIAIVGVALLFVQEMRHSIATPREVAIGIGLTFLGVLSASIANVMQVSGAMRSRPIAVMLAWAMFYGVLFNFAFAWATQGPPVIEYRFGYWLGLAYLGVLASALAFTLYFGIIRAVGPGRAAYSSVLVPIIAMGLSTLFEGYRWATLAIAGGVVALTGLVIALKARKA